MRIYLAILILACLALSQASINKSGCGRRPRKNKIVGGKAASQFDWGWLASVNVNGRSICGGSLIHPQWVLTAAHCLAYGTTASRYKVKIGVHDIKRPEKGSQTISVSKVIRHSRYSSRTQQNDVALFKLKTPAKVDGDSVVLACLQESKADLTNKVAWAVGWGRTKTNGPAPSKKQEVSKPIISTSECRRKFGSVIKSSQHVCAGRHGLGRDSCQGDSGGPLIVQDSKTKLWNQVGITSFGARNCGDGGVYVKVSSFISWIKNTMASN